MRDRHLTQRRVHPLLVNRFAKQATSYTNTAYTNCLEHLSDQILGNHSDK